MSIESLTEEVKQFNKEFKLWGDGAFAELSMKVKALVVETDGLVKQSKRINTLLDGMISNTNEIIKRLDKQLVEE